MNKGIFEKLIKIRRLSRIAALRQVQTLLNTKDAMATIFDIAFDENNDMYLDGADIAFRTEEDIVTQRISNRLQFFFGEWFLDTNAGLPYAQIIFEQGTDINSIYGLFYSQINNTRGVDSIQSLVLTPSTKDKSLSITSQVNRGTEQEVLITV